jgi:hypothetical protein
LRRTSHKGMTWIWVYLTLSGNPGVSKLGSLDGKLMCVCLGKGLSPNLGCPRAMWLLYPLYLIAEQSGNWPEVGRGIPICENGIRWELIGRYSSNSCVALLGLQMTRYCSFVPLYQDVRQCAGVLFILSILDGSTRPIVKALQVVYAPQGYAASPFLCPL